MLTRIVYYTFALLEMRSYYCCFSKTLRKEYSQLGCGWCHTRDVAAGNEANDNSDQEESSEAIPNVTLLTSNYRAYT